MSVREKLAVTCGWVTIIQTHYYHSLWWGNSTSVHWYLLILYMLVSCKYMTIFSSLMRCGCHPHARCAGVTREKLHVRPSFALLVLEGATIRQELDSAVGRASLVRFFFRLTHWKVSILPKSCHWSFQPTKRALIFKSKHCIPSFNNLIM